MTQVVNVPLVFGRHRCELERARLDSLAQRLSGSLNTSADEISAKWMGLKSILNMQSQSKPLNSGQQRLLLLCVIGSVSIALGLGVYLFVRGPSTLYIVQRFHLPAGLTALGGSLSFLRHWSGSFSSWAHAFGFSLLTTAIVWPCRPGTTCLVWGCIDTAFEALQALSLSSRATGGFFAGMICAYIANGTFDWADVAAIWLGVAMAYVVGGAFGYSCSSVLDGEG